MRQKILVEQEIRLLATNKLMLASNLGNNFVRKNTETTFNAQRMAKWSIHTGHRLDARSRLISHQNLACLYTLTRKLKYRLENIHNESAAF